MIRRSGSRIGRNRVRRHMCHINLVTRHKKVNRKHVPRTVVVMPNNMGETDFTKIYIEGEGWGNPTAYLDLYSRRINGAHRFSQSEESITNILKRIKKGFDIPS